MKATSSFVGRADELAQLHTHFLDGARLVTIWGPGGMGKTRLALEHARREEPSAITVDLSEANTEEGFTGELANALRVPIGSASSFAEVLAQLGRALHARRDAFVLFDNCEQIVELAAGAIALLLAAAPRARMLVTSRERLRIAGEVSFELQPLSLPRVARDQNGSDAEQLFLLRAKEQGLDLAGSDPRVGQVLHHLDGIPLAIELAVARLDVLGLDGLLARLPARLDLLSRAGRDAPPRHGTMRAAIAWSWDLLGPDEQHALATLGVFRGGFTLDAAEVVLGSASTLELVTSLRDRSLLRTEPGPRFRLYETVREFALEQLDLQGARELATRRHDEHFAARGAEWAARVDASGDAEARACLVRDLDNLLDVHARAVEAARGQKSVERAASALLAADVALTLRAPSSVRTKVWSAMRDLASRQNVELGLMARVSAACGRALHAAGDLEGAEEALRSALTLAEHSEQRAEIEAPIALDLGIALHARHDHAAARALYDRALAACAGKRTRRSEARALGNLAALDHDQGTFERARQRYSRSIAIAAVLGDARIEGIMTTNVAVLEQEEGKLERALPLYGRAISLLEGTEDVRLVAIARGNLGALYTEVGSLDEAQTELERALHDLRAIGDAHSLGLTLVRLGLAAALSGKDAVATEHLEQARAAFARTADQVGARIAQVVSQAIGVSTDSTARARDALAREHSLTTTSDDARTLFRILSRALDRLERGAAAEADADPEALVVAQEGAAFRPPRGAWQWLGEHKAARRVLQRLTSLRQQRGPGLGTDAVSEIGWPDQKLVASSATNRVYVLIAMLRKRGLPLLRTEDGYALDPAIRLQVVSRPPAGVGS